MSSSMSRSSSGDGVYFPYLKRIGSSGTDAVGSSRNLRCRVLWRLRCRVLRTRLRQLLSTRLLQFPRTRPRQFLRTRHRQFKESVVILLSSPWHRRHLVHRGLFAPRAALLIRRRLRRLIAALVRSADPLGRREALENELHGGRAQRRGLVIAHAEEPRAFEQARHS